MIEFDVKNMAKCSTVCVEFQLHRYAYLCWLIAALMCVCGVTLIVIQKGALDIVFGILLIALGVVYVPFVRWYAHKMQQKSSAVRLPGLTQHFVFTPEKVLISQMADAHYKNLIETDFSFFLGAHKFQNNYLLHTVTGQIFCLPVQDIKTGSALQFEALLQSKFAQSFGK